MFNEQNLILIVAFGIVIGGLLLILVLQHLQAKRELDWQRQKYEDLMEMHDDLMDRFMARDYQEYTTGRRIKGKASIMDEIMEDVTDEDRAEADGVPVI